MRLLARGPATPVPIALGGGFSCAVMSDATSSCWGATDDGQLGDGALGFRLAPTQVSGLSGVAQVAGGARFTCALLRDGTLRGWGGNTDGEIGDGTELAHTTPLAVRF